MPPRLACTKVRRSYIFVYSHAQRPSPLDRVYSSPIMNNVQPLAYPSSIIVSTEPQQSLTLERGSSSTWAAANSDVQVTTLAQGNQLRIELRGPQSAVRTVELRWNRPATDGCRYLGDHWERGYGDLEWRGRVGERVMPWYFLCFDGAVTHGYGVKTGASALCHWKVDGEGITLVLDVRSGGSGVQLGQRTLVAADVFTRPGQPDESPFQAACAFCRLLCDRPRMPAQPVYGGNNWYYAYGSSSHQQILADAELIASLSPRGDNRPIMVIDEGWQAAHSDAFSGGPWDAGNAKFPDMAELARRMKQLGTRPGIWIRPLFTRHDVPQGWRLPTTRFAALFRDTVLDPSVPEVLDFVAADIRRLVGWGYELIKHDFTTYDLCGLWGFQMADRMTADGWSFADRGRTTAEIILALYRAIRTGAGDAMVLGCNTIGHLAAGLVELQRTGDDTSGREWERTRKMGVNTLAFRMPQHGAFFAVDADCAAITPQIPWHLGRQWLDVLARSGTPLFVSADAKAIGPDQREALRNALSAAAAPQPLAEPLDWLDTTCPRHWRINGRPHQYAWSEK